MIEKLEEGDNKIVYSQNGGKTKAHQQKSYSRSH